jgi:hypothetical protein
MTSTLAASNERTLTQATVAFLTEHLGHRISTYNRHRGKHYYYRLATIDPVVDRAYEPYQRPYWLTGPDTHAYGPSHSIRYVFARADELTCTDCRISRAWSDAHAATLSALKDIAAPYLNGAAPALSRDELMRDAGAMARLIATLTTS